MEKFTVALVQSTLTGDIDSMKAQYRPLIAQARARGASVVCLPEFTLIPYFPGTRDLRGFEYAEAIDGGVSCAFFSEMAQTHGVTLVASLYEQDGDRYYDTATIHAADGALVGITRKVHIPSGDGYYETDFFGGGEQYPVWQTEQAAIAAPTCYDQWFPELARIYSLNGAEYIFYPTAIGSEPTDPDMDSSEAWQTVMRAHAIANGVYVGAANRVGVENGVTFYGSSFICDPMGNVLAQASRDQVEVITAELDPAVLARWRGLFPLLQQRKPQTYIRLTESASGGLPARFQAARQVND
ncbi:MAG: nitrilase-related carbon-nitrogen hydrolase [Phototrophicaceae bacterium]|jgi:N-carbamoylputrescine amidase